MTSRFVATIAAIAALSATAFAQDKALPKVSKAEVEQAITSIKNDKAKFAAYCELQKVQDQYQKITKQDDPALDELDKKAEELSKKLGPDFAKVAGSELDDQGVALFEGLAKSCG
jgi:hypothetical protein